MAGSPSNPLALARGGRLSFKVIFSYALDWIALVICGVLAVIFGNIEPNKRPFSLNDPNISFPYTENETVPSWLLVVLIGPVPLVIIAIVCLIFVPGATVPKNTPTALVWKRKLWELHVGWLGLILAIISAFFFTQGMKNMFGKPRPDLLDRCEPDVQNAQEYVVGGFSGENPLGLLYSADICQSTDSEKLDDGFRSYPSGHSSSAAAGLIYLSLFLATKFAVMIPFVSGGSSGSALAHSAFPSRHATGMSDSLQEGWEDNSADSPMYSKGVAGQNRQNAKISSLRRQAAAPPLYLLVITIAPFCVSIFIAASRWWDFRHHGFDILFGYIMGLITSVFSFRYYHLPIQDGAGWAWGPRSDDRAFWAGVGRMGYSSVGESGPASGSGHTRMAQSNDVELQPPHPPQASGHMMQRTTDTSYSNGAMAGNTYGEGPFQEVEMHRMDSRI